MFENPKLLNKSVHKELKLSPVKGVKFAENLSVTGLSHTEMVLASKCFPIVFWEKGETEQPVLPQAILSIEKDKNAFVTEDGTWTADYLPLHIRRYPFILGNMQEKNQFAVMIDENAPHFSTEKGDALFTEAGEPTEVLEKVQDFLKKYNQEAALTIKMVQEIDESGILKTMNFTVKKGKAGRNIKGFRGVDLKKMAALEDSVLGRWVKNGVMSLIYAHLFSLSNFAAIAKIQGLEPPVPETPES